MLKDLTVEKLNLEFRNLFNIFSHTANVLAFCYLHISLTGQKIFALIFLDVKIRYASAAIIMQKKWHFEWLISPLI